MIALTNENDNFSIHEIDVDKCPMFSRLEISYPIMAIAGFLVIDFIAGSLPLYIAVILIALCSAVIVLYIYLKRRNKVVVRVSENDYKYLCNHSTIRARIVLENGSVDAQGSMKPHLYGSGEGRAHGDIGNGLIEKTCMKIVWAVLTIGRYREDDKLRNDVNSPTALAEEWEYALERISDNKERKLTSVRFIYDAAYMAIHSGFIGRATRRLINVFRKDCSCGNSNCNCKHSDGASTMNKKF